MVVDGCGWWLGVGFGWLWLGVVWSCLACGWWLVVVVGCGWLWFGWLWLAVVVAGWCCLVLFSLVGGCGWFWLVVVGCLVLSRWWLVVVAGCGWLVVVLSRLVLGRLVAAGWWLSCLCLGVVGVGVAFVLPKVVGKGLPEATGAFFTDKLNVFKNEVIASQKLYGHHIINAEASLSLGALEEAVDTIDKEVERLSGVAESFKKGTGQDIKSLAR